MKNFIDRVLKIISSAIFVILVLIVVLALGYILRVRYLSTQGRLGEIKLNFYTILTQSMYPAIEAGDIIITYKNDDNIYNAGDVITFVSSANGGITITHRVEEVYSVNGVYSYKTKGDNNNVADREVVNSNDVLGKVVLKIPKAGYIQQFLVTRTGWIVAVVLPCMGIVIYDLLKMFKLTARKSNEIISKNKKTEEARKKLKKVIKDEN